MTFPARTRDDLDDASGRVQVSVRVLRREALVVVGVAVHDQVSVVVVEVLPERLYSSVGSDL